MNNLNSFTNVLIIDGKAYSSTITREIESPDFMAMFETKGTPPTPDAAPLPDHCRWFFETEYTLNYVIEIKPSIFPLKHVNWRRAYKVAFPWQYFVISFYRDIPSRPWHMVDPSIAWAKNRIRTLSETGIFRASLPNVYEGGYKICIGTTAPDSQLSPSDRVNEFINGFYTEGSEFNDDLSWHYPGNYNSIMDWVRDSKLNSFCWQHWPELYNSYGGGYSLYDLMHKREYDAAGNRVTEITNLNDLAERAQYIGRRPW